MAEWVKFIWPTIDFLISHQFYFAGVLVIVYGLLFGLHYEAINDRDPYEKYVMPVGGTVLFALLTIPFLTIVIFISPLLLALAFFAGVAYGVMRVGQIYKEGVDA